MSYTREQFDQARKHWSECHLCNIDRHLCPGCGDHLPHGIGACEECEARA